MDNVFNCDDILINILEYVINENECECNIRKLKTINKNWNRLIDYIRNNNVKEYIKHINYETLSNYSYDKKDMIVYINNINHDCIRIDNKSQYSIKKRKFNDSWFSIVPLYHNDVNLVIETGYYYGYITKEIDNRFRDYTLTISYLFENKNNKKNISNKLIKIYNKLKYMICKIRNNIDVRLKDNLVYISAPRRYEKIENKPKINELNYINCFIKPKVFFNSDCNNKCEIYFQLHDYKISNNQV